MQSRAGEQLRQLATLVGAGIPVLDAWERVLESQSGPARVRHHNHHKQQGTPLHELLLRDRCITPAQSQRLALAEAHGGLVDCLRQLAAEAEQRHFRWMRLRARLGLSFGILAIAVLAGLLVVIADPQASTGAFLGRAVIGMGPPVALVLMSRSLFQRDTLWWSQLHRRLPRWARPSMLTLAFETTWYRLLHAQLAAGRDAAGALETLAPLLRDRPFERRVRSAARETRQGQSLTQALNRAGLATSADISSALHTGEASGRLNELLDRLLSDRERRLQASLSQLEQWWPRLLYLVAILGAAHIISGPG